MRYFFCKPKPIIELWQPIQIALIILPLPFKTVKLLPVFYYIHGGGFVAGGPEVVEEMCKLVVLAKEVKQCHYIGTIGTSNDSGND